MNKRKLLFIYRYCNMGGVASVIKQRFARLHHEYDFECAFCHDAGTGSREWGKAGITAHIMGKDFGGGLGDLLRSEAWHAVTIIDTPEAFPSVAEVLPSRLVYEVHTSYFENIRPSVEALHAARVVVVPSCWLRDVLDLRFHCSPDKIRVIPNMVDESLFRYVPPDKEPDGRLLVWVGKLDENKNWRDGLAVFDQLLRLHPDCRVLFVTGGNVSLEMGKEFVGEIIRRGLLGRLSHMHHVPYQDMARLYSEAAASGGLLLSTSLHESFSMIVHEAWRCRLPAVCCGVGPISETIEDGQDGFLFEPYDVSTAVEKCSRLLSDPDLHSQMLTRATAKVARFNAASIVPLYRSVLDQLGMEQDVPISLLI